jgi:hypothetical protein
VAVVAEKKMKKRKKEIKIRKKIKFRVKKEKRIHPEERKREHEYRREATKTPFQYSNLSHFQKIRYRNLLIDFNFKIY